MKCSKNESNGSPDAINLSKWALAGTDIVTKGRFISGVKLKCLQACNVCGARFYRFGGSNEFNGALVDLKV